MTRIVAVRSAFPAYRYPQHDLTQAVASLARRGAAGGTSGSGADEFGKGRRALLERLHASAGVDTRHTVLPLAEYGALGDANGADGPGGTINDRYIDEATALGERALRAALAESGLTAADLDLLIVTSVTGVAVPSLDARLIPRLGLRTDVRRLPVFGLGCVAGAAGMARMHDYLLGWPRHAAALLAVELCSLSWPRPSAPRATLTTADLVASALFGDGAAALVATGSRARKGAAARAPGLPKIIATRSEVYPDSGDALGWRLAPGGFRIVLTAELADVVERRLSASVTGFLAGQGLTADDIRTWICHPGGPKVLDAATRALKLPDTALATSRRSLAEAGNLSSASVLHILELTVASHPQAPGSFGLLIGLGPGVSAELVLLRW
jgi:alkylresorcinol/alkylpyrone synthase